MDMNMPDMIRLTFRISYSHCSHCGIVEYFLYCVFPSEGFFNVKTPMPIVYSIYFDRYSLIVYQSISFLTMKRIYGLSPCQLIPYL